MRRDDPTTTRPAGRLSRLRAHWPVPALLALTAVYFRPALLGSGFFFLDILFTEKVPFWTFAQEELRAGALPLWTKHIYAGFPLVANSHVGIFYPPNWPALLLLPVPWAVNWTTVAHYLVAGIGVYAYLRTIRLEAWPALFGALAFELSGFVLLYHVSGSGLSTFTWLPVVLACVERARAEADHRWYAGAAVALGATVLGGHLQYAIYCFYAAALYVVWIGIGRPWGRSMLQAGALVALIAGTAVALGAAQLVPTYEAMHFAARDALTFKEAVGVRGDSLDLRALFEILSPRAFGGIHAERFFYPSYLGALPLLLAPLAWVRIRDRRVSFWTFAIVFAVLNAAGDATPFYYLTLWLPIPGFHFAQSPQRIMLLFVLGTAVLSAIGLATAVEDLRAERDVRGVRWVAAAAALVLVGWIGWHVLELRALRTGGTSAGLAQVPPEHRAIVAAWRQEDLLWFVGFGVTTALLLVWARVRGGAARAFGPVACVAVAANLALHGQDVIAYAPEEVLTRKPPVLDHVADTREDASRIWVYETEDRYWHQVHSFWSGWPFAGEDGMDYRYLVMPLHL